MTAVEKLKPTFETRKKKPLTFYDTGCLIGQWFITIPIKLGSISSPHSTLKTRVPLATHLSRDLKTEVFGPLSLRALENDELRRDSLFSSLKRGMVGRGVGMSGCFLEKTHWT